MGNGLKYLPLMGGGNEVVGKDGESAYEIAKDYGFDGTEEEWLTSLKGSNGISYNDIDYTKVITQETQIYSGEYPGVKFTATNDGQALARIYNAGSTSTTQNYSLWIIDNTIGKSIGGGCFILNHATSLSFPVKKGHVYLIQSFSAVSMNVLEVSIHPYKDNNSYSTEEQVIGTWINNKPIYRKVIQVIGPSAIKAWQEVYDVTDLNIDSMISISGMSVIPAGACIPINSTGNNNVTFVNAMLGNNKDKINIISNAEGTVNSNNSIILEYTKTTDIV